MIVVIGSANLDIVNRVDRIPRPGETVLSSSREQGAGGKGANQAIATARAGAEVVFIGSVGTEPESALLLDALAGAGIRAMVRRSTVEPTGAAFVTVSAEGENAIVVAPGANSLLRKLTDAEREVVRNAQYVLMQLETPAELAEEVASAAREAGTTMVLNASPSAAVTPRLLESVDVLVVNESEARDLLATVDSADSADPARELAKIVPSVVLTLGSEGAVLVNEHESVTVPAFPAEVVDTTGAGDTFCGALVAALSRGDSLAEAGKFASAAASLSVRKTGAAASIPSRAEVEAFLGELPC